LTDTVIDNDRNYDLFSQGVQDCDFDRRLHSQFQSLGRRQAIPDWDLAPAETVEFEIVRFPNRALERVLHSVVKPGH
jgi:hypothetical protein